MSASAVGVETASWQDEAARDAMVAIRREVFVVEQQVPLDVELDGRDPECRHLLAFESLAGSSRRAIGTARMTPTGHVGRIAVVADQRKRGVGSRLVGSMIALARELGLDSVDLDSQVHAIPFYERLGFEVRGEEFIEAGIPHRNMVRPLAGTGS